METKSNSLLSILPRLSSKWKNSPKTCFPKSYHIFILYILICSILINLVASDDHEHHDHDGGLFKDCEIVFENEDMRVRVRDECNKTNPIDEAKIVENYPIGASLDSFDFDDNCFTGCVYKAEQIISEDGTLNRDQVQHFFKSNMTSELFTKLTSIFYACIDVTNRIADKREMDVCRKASLHEFCVVKGIVASAHELLKMDC